MVEEELKTPYEGNKAVESRRNLMKEVNYFNTIEKNTRKSPVPKIIDSNKDEDLDSELIQSKLPLNTEAVIPTHK